MKKFSCFIYFILGFITISVAQEKHTDTIHSMLPEDNVPLVLKFEPNLNSTANRKRVLFEIERKSIDTMQISVKKKQRLLRSLYKKIHTGTFNSSMITNSVFEDDVD